MKKTIEVVVNYFRRSDTPLLLLCLAATIYGILLIDSATRYTGSSQNVIIQAIALFIGLLLYLLFSIIDLEIIADKWLLLLLFDVLFIGSLFVFGEAGDSGNSAWLRFGAIGIQPAEIVKIPFTILVGRQLCHYRERRGVSHPFSIIMLCAHFGLMFGLIVLSSSDLGSALVYAFIFLVMLFVGGVKWYWFAAAIGVVAVSAPYIWTHLLTDNQKSRILAPYDPTVDPTGLGITWQPNQAKAAIASGELFGKGFLQGDRTQTGGIPQQQTDFIFGVAGEELGFIGCVIIVGLITAIVVRCFVVGLRCNNRLGLYVCFGIGSMLMFQMLENIGMCLGILPVIGLTLPFFSYGGSSIITLFAAMGIVSGVRMHRNPKLFWMGNIG